PVQRLERTQDLHQFVAWNFVHCDREFQLVLEIPCCQRHSEPWLSRIQICIQHGHAPRFRQAALNFYLSCEAGAQLLGGGPREDLRCRVEYLARNDRVIDELYFLNSSEATACDFVNDFHNAALTGHLS